MLLRARAPTRGHASGRRAPCGTDRAIVPGRTAGTPEGSALSRVVLIVLVILAVIFLVRGFGRSRGRGDADGQRRSLPDQKMVQCAHCGIYVPEAAAIEVAGLHYCSDEHRRLSGN